MPPKGVVFEGICNFCELSVQDRIERFDWYPVEGYLHNQLTHVRSDTFEVQPNKLVFTLTPRPDIEITADRKSQILNSITNNAKNLLDKTDWKVLRHLEEISTGQETSLSQSQYEELTNLRKQIRINARNKSVLIEACKTTEQIQELTTSDI